MTSAELNVNGRPYRLPTQPTVVVCVDGCEPDYLAQAVATGHMPWLKRTLALGSGLTADCVVPSLPTRIICPSSLVCRPAFTAFAAIIYMTRLREQRS